MNVKVEFYSPSIVRIYKTPKDKPYVRESQVVVKTPEQVSVQYTNKGGNVLMKSAELQVEFNPLTGGVYFYDTHGKLLLKDKDYGTSFAHKDDAGTPAFQVRNAFLLEADEPIYGIGQVWDGKLNRRNSVHQMRNENTLTYSPYFMSPTKDTASTGTIIPYPNLQMPRRNCPFLAWDIVPTIISCSGKPLTV